MEHTKGPWVQYGNDIFRGYPDDYEIGDWRCIATCHNENAPANARLIAASPDMYKALKLYVERAEESGQAVNREAWIAAKEAIAKAEGTKA